MPNSFALQLLVALDVSAPVTYVLPSSVRGFVLQSPHLVLDRVCGRACSSWLLMRTLQSSYVAASVAATGMGSF